MLPACRFFAVQAEREALGAAAGFDELIERRLLGQIAAVGQLGLQLRAAGVGDDRLAHHDRIAGKTPRFVAIDFNQIGHVLGQRPLAVFVKGRRIVDGSIDRERTEAGVEVIVIGVDQFERDYANAEQFSNLLLTPSVAAYAIAREQRFTAEQGIARSLEVSLLGDVAQAETVAG